MRRGLTTVEVLVASAIVLAFLAVGIPAARALLGRSRVSACAERLHTLGAALAMYANDHDGALPAATTVETAYQGLKGVPEDEVLASPEVLRGLLAPYALKSDAWFCPLDPHKGESALWLGQRHAVTSFRYAPKPSGEEPLWPPRLQLGKDGEPLAGDAFGLDAGRPASNHPDGSVNQIAHDLSLARRRARTSSSPNEVSSRRVSKKARMVRAHHDFTWHGVDVHPYREEGGTHFKSITRQTLYKGEESLPVEFRYFEIGPGGHSTLERHDHLHVVMVVRGRGRALVGGEITAVGLYDVVHVPSQTWHQFRAEEGDPLGFVCLVSADRDRPCRPQAEDLESLPPEVRAFVRV